MQMEEGAPRADLAALLKAAADFGSYPGLQNSESAKEFLDSFPLPVIFGVLQNEAGLPGLEDTIVACLDRLFQTKYGASLLPRHLPIIQAGLQANSQIVRCLACKSVYYILENAEDRTIMQMIVEYHIYPLLINCLLDGNEQTSAASLNAITSIAQSPEGPSIIFPSSTEESVQLKDVAANCSSVARIRILGLIAKLFSLSSTLASAVYDSNLLNLFEVEINDRSDMLRTLSALELLYELVESPHSSRFLLKTSLLQQLANLISNSSDDSILWSRALLISGRLLSSSDAYTTIKEESIKSLLSSIERRLELLKTHDTDEYESALEALSQIGMSARGASLLLTSSYVLGRHVIQSAFRHGRVRQLAALHALGNICGVNRSEDNVLLDDYAETFLKCAIFGAAATTPKLTPSGIYLSLLQQEPEMRLAAYRLLSVLVARPWCFTEVFWKPEIITILTDANIESTKDGMEARHQCCTAMVKALSASDILENTTETVTKISRKLQDAVKSGPYLAKKHIEAQPIVVTAERF